MPKLNVGCGIRPLEGWVNLDKFKLKGVDCVFDLDSIQSPSACYLCNGRGTQLCGTEKDPGSDSPLQVVTCAMCGGQGTVGRNGLAYPADYFDEIRAEDVLEHVDDLVTVVQELGRVLKPGGKLWVRGPHCNYPEQVWADPTHKRAFAPRSFDNFDPSTYDGKHYSHYFGPIKFHVVEWREVNKGLEFTLIKRKPDGTV